MGHALRMLAALVGAAALGCGSIAANVDAGVQDASVDHVADACSVPFSCVDAQPDGSGITQVVCPDGGYYITIDGDGVTQTLSANSQLVECCGYTALTIVAPNPDGGAGMRLEQACSKDPDGGLTFQSGPDYAAYFRSDGTTFGSNGDASLTTVYTDLGPPGSVVAGSYAVTVAQADAATLSLSGTFFTCRMDDAICACPPPPGP